MRALGPGSVSSFLKVILDVVFVALWVAGGAAALAALAALLLPSDLEFWRELSVKTDAGHDIAARGPILAAAMGAVLLYIGGVIVIVGRLRRVFDTLTAGDPFHPDNVGRLRLIGGTLAALEVSRYLLWGVTAVLSPDLSKEQSGISLTAWFSVLVVFVLAEVFREGARLRREAELTI